MKKLILNWLFGIDNVEQYMDLLAESIAEKKRLIEVNEEKIKILKESIEDLTIIRNLIKICENHGINPDEEIKHIEL